MNKLLTLICMAVALVLAAGCSREVTVKIGVAAPMSGPLAQYGKDIAHGAEIAVDELNATDFWIGGKRGRFQLVIEDDKASPEEGQRVATRLIEAGVNGVFGHFNSGVTIAAAPVYAKAGIPQLAVSTNPKYTRMGLKTAFRIVADDTEQGATLGRLVADKLRAKSVYVIDDKTTFGVGLAEIVSQLLGDKKIKAQQASIDPKAADYPALAQAVVAAKVDTVLFAGDEGAGLPLLKALRQAGSTAQFVAPDAMCDPSTIKNAKGTADSNFYCTIAGIPPSWLGTGIGFTQMYQARFGAPGSYSPLAYDGVHVLAQAMQEAGSTDPRDYLPKLAQGSFNGKVQGVIEFDPKGDVKDGLVVVFQAIGGKLSEQRNLMGSNL
ncbi:MAG: branched-chain amino acid ABC transporter substrate-binding protein [Burkholderiaceae bacterium]